MDEQTRDEYHAELARTRAELRAIQGGGEGADADAKPRPIRQAEVLRFLLMERLARHANTSRATVRLTRNAKGDVQPEVMVEVTDEDASDAIARAQLEAQRTFDALCHVYALGVSPPAPAEGSAS